MIEVRISNEVRMPFVSGHIYRLKLRHKIYCFLIYSMKSMYNSYKTFAFQLNGCDFGISAFILFLNIQLMVYT
jgi:hypothetical protein